MGVEPVPTPKAPKLWLLAIRFIDKFLSTCIFLASISFLAYPTCSLVGQAMDLFSFKATTDSSTRHEKTFLMPNLKGCLERWEFGNGSEEWGVESGE